MTLENRWKIPRARVWTAPMWSFDLETTGFSPVENKIIEIGAVKVENGRDYREIQHVCQSGGAHPIPDRGTDRASATIWYWMHLSSRKILPEFLKFCEGAVMVAHNASFDMSFIEENCRRQGLGQRVYQCGYRGTGPIPAAAPSQCQAGYGGESPERVSGKSPPGGG